MAWTTPRTYVAGELMTAAIGNTHIRDNFNILKVSISDDGGTWAGHVVAGNAKNIGYSDVKWSRIDSATVRLNGAQQVTTIAVVDTGADHYLSIACGENLSAARTLTLVIGNADRTLTISGNFTLNQSVASGAAPTFTGTNFSGIPNSATTAASANTNSAIVARDGSGNFSATTITANLSGNASGTAATVTGGTQAAITICANLVTVGALDAGSITSSFGSINVGTDAITGGAGTFVTLSVTRTTDGNTADIVNSNASFASELFTLHASRAASASYVFANFYANGVSQFSVSGTGAVVAAAAITSNNGNLVSTTAANGGTSVITWNSKDSTSTARQMVMGLGIVSDNIFSITNGTTEWMRIIPSSGQATWYGAGAFAFSNAASLSVGSGGSGISGYGWSFTSGVMSTSEPRLDSPTSNIYATGGNGATLRLGRNNAPSNAAAGTIEFIKNNGTSRFMWVDVSSVVHIGAAGPGTSNDGDGGGTVVGDQTSWYGKKTGWRERRDASAALDRVCRTKVYDYYLKNTSYRNPAGGRHRFTGPIGFKRSAWFLKNVGPKQDPCFDDVTIIGNLMLAVRALRRQVHQLEKRAA